MAHGQSIIEQCRSCTVMKACGVPVLWAGACVPACPRARICACEHSRCMQLHRAPVRAWLSAWPEQSTPWAAHRVRACPVVCAACDQEPRDHEVLWTGPGPGHIPHGGAGRQLPQAGGVASGGHVQQVGASHLAHVPRGACREELWPTV